MSKRTAILGEHHVKSYTSSAGWYSLTIPDDWEVEESNDCASFFRGRDGKGVLQVSAYRAPVQQLAEEVLAEHIRDQGIPVSPESIATFRSRLSQVAYCEYVGDRYYRRIWIITCASNVVFATYICDKDEQTKELSLAEDIIRSLFMPHCVETIAERN